MSFPEFRTDIADIARLLSDLLGRVRTKQQQEFRPFSEEILRASTCICHIEANSALFFTRISKLNEVDQPIPFAVFLNIRTEFEKLQREMNNYNERNTPGQMLDPLVVERLRGLHGSLQFHVRMLGILNQSFALEGGTRMAEAIQRIRTERPDVQHISPVDSGDQAQESDFPKNEAPTGGQQPAMETFPTTAEPSGADSMPQTVGDNNNNLNGPSDIAVEAAVPESARDDPPAHAFLWQFMLWDIRRRARCQAFCMIVGLYLPMTVALGSIIIASFLIGAFSIHVHMPVSGVQMGYPVSFRILANCLILGTSLVFWNLSLRKHSLPRCVLQATYFGFIGLVGSIALFTCGLDDLSSSWTYLYTPSPGILKARTALSIFLGLGGLYGVFGALFVFGPRMKPS